jgi:hypothetical protein
MGLYALYCNATPRPSLKEVDAPVSDDHVVNIAKLGAVELNTHYPVGPPPPAIKDNGAGGEGNVDKATQAEQV